MKKTDTAYSFRVNSEVTGAWLCLKADMAQTTNLLSDCTHILDASPLITMQNLKQSSV